MSGYERMQGRLTAALSASVPLRIQELERLPAEVRERELDDQRERLVDLIASKADVMLYGGGKPGEAAEVFNALSDALAHLAFAPGGVRVFGLHFAAGEQPA